MTLQERSALLRDATQEGEITAAVCGQLLVDISHEVEETLPAAMAAVVADIPASSGRDANQMTVRNAQGQDLFTLPYATDTLAGVMTAANKRALFETEARSQENATAITAEATARQTADEALGTRIDNEATARATAISTERTARQNADAALRTDLTGVTTTVTEHTGRLNTLATDLATETSARTQAITAEATARQTADDTLTASVAAALNTALGTGTQTAWEAPIKRVQYASDAALCRLVNTALTDGTTEGNASRGMVRYCYAQTGSHFLILTMGMNENAYPTNASRGCLQVAIGGVTAATNFADDTGHDWSEDGVPNAIRTAHSNVRILIRKLSYTGAVRNITPWQDYAAYTVGINTALASAFSDAAMRSVYPLSNGRDGLCAYNAETGYYEMNGLTDITPDEMRQIWAFTANKEPGIYTFSGLTTLRTNYPFSAKHSVDRSGVVSQNFFGLFQACSRLEVANLCGIADYGLRGQNMKRLFRACTRLHTVTGGKIYLNMIADTAGLSEMFYGCAALVSVELYGLKISGLSLADSPLLSAASVSYLVENAANEAAITVTVHADTLAHITAGTGDWAGIAAAATARNIAFVS